MELGCDIESSSEVNCCLWVRLNALALGIQQGNHYLSSNSTRRGDSIPQPIGLVQRSGWTGSDVAHSTMNYRQTRAYNVILMCRLCMARSIIRGCMLCRATFTHVSLRKLLSLVLKKGRLMNLSLETVYLEQTCTTLLVFLYCGTHQQFKEQLIHVHVEYMCSKSP